MCFYKYTHFEWFVLHITNVENQTQPVDLHPNNMIDSLAFHISIVLYFPTTNSNWILKKNLMQIMFCILDKSLHYLLVRFIRTLLAMRMSWLEPNRMVFTACVLADASRILYTRVYITFTNLIWNRLTQMVSRCISLWDKPIRLKIVIIRVFCDPN